MTQHEIEQVMLINRVSKEDVLRVTADHKRMEQVKQEFPWCTEQQAVMYILDDEQFVRE